MCVLTGPAWQREVRNLLRNCQVVLLAGNSLEAWGWVGQQKGKGDMEQEKGAAVVCDPWNLQIGQKYQTRFSLS